MTKLTKDMYNIFDRDEFSFKKLKEQYSPEEIDEIKAKFKSVWQTWKLINQNCYAKLPEGKFAKLHVESWTNGWNLRDHFWASYRLKKLEDKSPCIGVMLDKKQFQVYLMFQHYKSNQRGDNPQEYNQLLDKVPAWSKNKDLNNWFLWDKDEMEFANHLALTDYLHDTNEITKFNNQASKSSFLLGKFVFYPNEIDDCEQFIVSCINDLLPLYDNL